MVGKIICPVLACLFCKFFEEETGYEGGDYSFICFDFVLISFAFFVCLLAFVLCIYFQILCTCFIGVLQLLFWQGLFLRAFKSF